MLCCGDDDALVLLPIDILTLLATPRSRNSVSQPCFAFLLDIQYKTATEQITRTHRYLGMDRRSFLLSGSAVAATLLAANQVNAAHGMTGGFFQLSPDSQHEPALADSELGGDEFIFDIQGHFVDPKGRWLNQVPEHAKPFSSMPAAQCALADMPGNRSYLQCLGPEQFVKDVFMDSGAGDI